MIVEPVRLDDADGRTTRRARVRWAGGTTDLWVAGPSEHVDHSDDATGFALAALPVAMVLGEDLTVAGPVSGELVERLPEIVAALSAWNPWRAIAVRVEPAPDQPASGGWVSFFSRGVDSLFTAAHRVDADPPLVGVVFGRGLEPRHDEAVALAEVATARTLADRRQLPLIVVDSNVRSFTDRFGTDWDDVLGPGLAFLGHALAGSCRGVIIPSSDSWATVEPCGSNPLVDPLLSSGRLAVEHDSIRLGRLGKVRWLVEHAPDLLDGLKVCYSENRHDNCGRCGKCVFTMVCLHLAGGLALADLFPARLDLDLVRSMRLPHVQSRLDWAAVAADIDPAGPDADLRAAVLDVLAASALPNRYRAETGDRWTVARWTRDHRNEQILSLLLEGRPSPRLPDDRRAPVPDRLRLHRVTDGPCHRCCVGASRLPGSGPVAELGTLVGLPLPGAVPVWLDDEGHLRTRGMAVPGGPRGPAALRWLLAPPPLHGGGHGGVAPTTLRRVLALARRHRRCVVGDPRAIEGEPVGYLHQREGTGRVALRVRWHPALGDQLATTDDEPDLDRWARAAGYGEPILLGYVDAVPAR